MRCRRLASARRLAAVALPLALCHPTFALAHARLLSADPAANAALKLAPTELRLKFSEALELAFSRARLTGPGGTSVPTAPARLDASDPTRLVIPLTAPLADGRYVVDWQAVAADGHKTTGGYSFSITK